MEERANNTETQGFQKYNEAVKKLDEEKKRKDKKIHVFVALKTFFKSFLSFDSFDKDKEKELKKHWYTYPIWYIPAKYGKGGGYLTFVSFIQFLFIAFIIVVIIALVKGRLNFLFK